MLDLDPRVFGPVAAVDVFNANGDQNGRANVASNHVVVQFSSDSGGIGRLPGVPISTVTLPVLPSVENGVNPSLSLRPGDTPWKDAAGNLYTPTAQTAQFKVGGAVSIDSVTPGGGLLPSGTAVRIAGRGFTASTTVQIDGVALSSTTFIGPQAIDIVLAAPTDLTGKRVVLVNPGGVQADFFSALRGDVMGSSNRDIRLIFPQQTYVTGSATSDGIALQNPTLGSVDVSLATVVVAGKGFMYGQQTITLPPAGIFDHETLTSFSPQYFAATSTKPIRMLSGQRGLGNLSVTWADGTPNCEAGNFGRMSTTCWVLLAGSPPAVKNLVVSLDDAVPFTVTTTAEGGQWLTLSPERGTTCASFKAPNATCPDGQITLTADPSLPPGDYKAIVTVTPDDPSFLPVTLPFTFRVAKSLVSFKNPPKFLYFTAHQSDPPPLPPVGLDVTATEDGTPFSVRVEYGQPNGKWLLVSPTQGVTPATIGVTVDPSSQNSPTAFVVVTGPSNSVSELVGMLVYPPPIVFAYPGSLTFWAKLGGDAPASQTIGIGGTTPADAVVAVETDRGAWLIVSSDRSAMVDATGLSAGTYWGSVTISSGSHTDYQSARVPVTLVVWDDAPQITVVPSNLTLTAPSGAYPRDGDLLSVSSDGKPIDFFTAISTDDGNKWLSLRSNANDFSFPPYGLTSVVASPLDLPPGTYHGTIKITAPLGSPTSTNIPVTFNVTAALPLPTHPGPPLAISIVNAASLTAGAISPGELLTIFGLNIGPSPAAAFSLDDHGHVATDLAGLRVLFDGVPAPLLYASPTQVNVVVPYEVGGKTLVPVVVEFNGARFSTGLPVAPSAPAIFTSDDTGFGQVRGLTGPAARGSVIHLLATGLGETVPAGTTGEISSHGVKKPILPVSIKIGGIDAPVQTVGSVEDSVAGVFGLDVVVPSGVTPGTAVAVVLKSGSVQSQDGVTIAVR